MSLTDLQIRNAKPKEKPYKLSDGEGLYLLVTPKGQKYWRRKYRFNGKEKTFAMGVYPDATGPEARKAARAAKEKQKHAVILLVRGATVSLVAKALGVSETTIYNWKSDDRFIEDLTSRRTRPATTSMRYG